MGRPEVLPITDEALNGFSAFLQQQFGNGFSREQWQAGFNQEWCEDKPNNGFMLWDDSRIVGALGAIYADRRIQGNMERFCNITSWAVEPKYRMHSMRLATTLTAQEGLHFTDFTPTHTVAKSLAFLKFKAIDARQMLVPNLPSTGGGKGTFRIIDNFGKMRDLLSDDSDKVLDDHQRLPWLRQVLAIHPDGAVHIVYKPIRFRRTPCAFILAVSDRDGFARVFSAFRHYLLFDKKIVFTRLERRFLSEKPLLTYALKRAPRKLFYSPRLTESDIDNLYSELVSLDLPDKLL